MEQDWAVYTGAGWATWDCCVDFPGRTAETLYDFLHECDKQTIKIHLKTMPQLIGCFCHLEKVRAIVELISRYVLHLTFML